MARKLAPVPPSPHADFSELQRMVRSLRAPHGPEARRVFAAARVGLRLLQERADEVKRAKAALVPQLHARRKRALRAVAGGTPVCEHKLPGCIQEMLAQYRRDEADSR